ncbi:MAG: ATPase, T2SS/T4P/T4SS family [Phycisphaeraceae bacterium]|jgi:type IV pilus assembly protein PilB|nr:ATPase, T2SS/T4P/T4SS family [Phycisphaeraceae bacterium]
MARTRQKIEQILKEWGKIDDQQIVEADKLAQGSRRRVEETLVELGYVDETDVAKALATQHDMEYIDLNQQNAIDPEAVALLPRDIVKKYLVLPVSKENGRLKVIIHDPMDLETLDNLRFRMNCEIETAIAARGKIKEYIDQMLSETRSSIDEAVRQMTVDARDTSLDIRTASIDQEGVDGADESDAQQAPIIRLVDHIITEAVRGRASDIHIEPFKDRVRLRYRVDGVCVEQEKVPKRTQSAVIARIKIMSGMRIEEKRVPQDGRIKARIDGDVIDFRVSVCPAYHGESVVLRILRPESARIGLINLGMRQDTLELFERTIRRPNGILLVCGPTGSGKTTTLYSALDVLNRPDRKIITAEDPVEYNFKGINQCQVNEGIGLTFSNILRAMLRQAPNVILVGEIRDQEVGDVAIQAALTGHLVFSTLHTNDAPSAITRLIDMGIKPFLVASSIQAVLAQRLVRILCDSCKQPDEDPDLRLVRLCGLTEQELEGKTIYKSAGCNACNHTGYRGRRGIFEYMEMNTELRELAFARSAVNKLRIAANATGMRNLLGDGKLKILDGETTLEEISRITQVAGVSESSTDG